MYVWVAARFYFLLCFVDAYSRYVVHHKLLISLNGEAVSTELQAALEAGCGQQTSDCTTTGASSSTAMSRR
jgi:hypothetical protein